MNNKITFFLLPLLLMSNCTSIKAGSNRVPLPVIEEETENSPSPEKTTKSVPINKSSKRVSQKSAFSGCDSLASLMVAIDRRIEDIKKELEANSQELAALEAKKLLLLIILLIGGKPPPYSYPN